MATRDVKTLCPYCGVGCGLIATTDGQKILRVRGDGDHPANFGKVCLKGATASQTVNVPTRLHYPMIRQANGELAVVQSENAIAHVAAQLERILQAHGPDAIAFYLSGQLTTESQYLAAKFAKGYLRTNHVDSNSRLCMASAASGMNLSFGSDGPPCCYADIELADTFLFVGSNAAECHPVAFERVAKRVRGGHARCIVVDPRRTTTAELARIHLPVTLGTDLALMNGLLRLLRDWNKLDQEYIQAHTEGWEELSQLLDEYTVERVADICRIGRADILAAVHLVSEASRLITFWTMGVNQTIQGTFTSNAIANLHLAMGQIGKEGCGPFSLTGQPNAMGGRDCGYMSHSLPGQRVISNDQHRAEMENFWSLPRGHIRAQPGHDAVAMFQALRRGDVRAIWIIGTNPAASMPNLPQIREALSRAELVIVQDAYFPTETTPYAHVVLPAAVNFEQCGVFCNSERSVSLMEQVIAPPGQARPDWWWVREVARTMGFEKGMNFAAAADIFDEFARSTAGRPDDQSALHHELLRRAGPQQWPYPAMGRSEARRYTDGKFATPSGRARFWARHHELCGEPTHRDYPFLLTTGRILAHWHSCTKTGLVPQLNELAGDTSYVSMNPADARVFGLANGKRVLVTSRRGAAESTVRVDGTISPGVVFMPIHWNGLFAATASPNEATLDATDPLSGQPSLKCCAVRVTAIEQSSSGSEVALLEN